MDVLETILACYEGILMLLEAIITTCWDSTGIGLEVMWFEVIVTVRDAIWIWLNATVI